MGAQLEVALDFGAFPGTTDVVQDLAATGVVSTSAIEAWLQPEDTAEHNIDEQLMEEGLVINAYFKSNDIITIYGRIDSPEPRDFAGGLLYGRYNVGVVWN